MVINGTVQVSKYTEFESLL